MDTPAIDDEEGMRVRGEFVFVDLREDERANDGGDIALHCPLRTPMISSLFQFPLVFVDEVGCGSIAGHCLLLVVIVVLTLINQLHWQQLSVHRRCRYGCDLTLFFQRYHLHMFVVAAVIGAVVGGHENQSCLIPSCMSIPCSSPPSPDTNDG